MTTRILLLGLITLLCACKQSSQTASETTSETTSETASENRPNKTIISELHLSGYDRWFIRGDWIRPKAIIQKDGRTIKFSEYRLAWKGEYDHSDDDDGHCSTVSFQLYCYEFNDTAVSLLTVPCLSLIINTKDCFKYCHLSQDDKFELEKNASLLYEDMDSLLRFADNRQLLPVAPLCKTGLADTAMIRDNWQINFRKIINPFDVTLVCDDGYDYSFKYPFPFKMNDRRDPKTISRRLKRLPPFLLPNIGRFTKVLYSGDTDIDFNVYFRESFSEFDEI